MTPSGSSTFNLGSGEMRLNRTGTSEYLKLNTYYLLTDGNDQLLGSITGATSIYAGSGVSPKMTITSGGFVGIGTTPSTFLHVLGSNTSARGQLSIQSNNASNGAKATWYYDTTLQGEIGTTSGDFYALAVNNFLFYAGGAERMRITSDGNLNVTGTVAMSSPFIFRNKIINGAMTIDQRNGGAAITTDGGYPVDRFVIYTGGSANLTNQRSTTVPTGFRNSLSVTVGTGVNTSSGDYVTIRHGIEGLNIYDLAWGTASAKNITLSFWVRSSLTGNFGVALRNNANNYGYVASYNIPSANTWTYITTTIPGPTSGTWNTDNTLGIRVIWDLGVGTSYSIAAGAWTSQSEILGLTGGVKLKATTGATFNITGIQFEAGNIATPFEHRPTSIEELLCKRYYEKEVFTGGFYFVPQIAGTQTYATISYKAEKRTDPQVALPQVSTATDTSNRTAVSNGVHRGSWYATLGGSLTNNVNSFTFTAECEL
jgi:hypothetical protein